jgi:hypothetical protein
MLRNRLANGPTGCAVCIFQYKPSCFPGVQDLLGVMDPELSWMSRAYSFSSTTVTDLNGVQFVGSIRLKRISSRPSLELKCHLPSFLTLNRKWPILLPI